jgi:hypothetical protein
MQVIIVLSQNGWGWQRKVSCNVIHQALWFRIIYLNVLTFKGSRTVLRISQIFIIVCNKIFIRHYSTDGGDGGGVWLTEDDGSPVVSKPSRARLGEGCKTRYNKPEGVESEPRCGQSWESDMWEETSGVQGLNSRVHFPWPMLWILNIINKCTGLYNPGRSIHVTGVSAFTPSKLNKNLF